jgi:PLP dependent protein
VFKISIKENLQDVIEKAEKALLEQGKTIDDIVLIGVTKTIDLDRINEAISLGIKDIGENKVQEIQDKYDGIEGSPRLHMIGHLQTNKVKYIVDKVDLIHSLDRASLAKEIQKRAEQHGLVKDVLIQVNVAEEDSKFGLKVEEVDDFAESLIEYPNLRVKGLMTIAPFEEDPEKTRYVFRTMKEIFERIKSKGYSNFDMEYLSMGMTNDYEIALEEGANMIRVGTGIFGKRNYV